MNLCPLLTQSGHHAQYISRAKEFDQTCNERSWNVWTDKNSDVEIQTYQGSNYLGLLILIVIPSPRVPNTNGMEHQL